MTPIIIYGLGNFAKIIKYYFDNFTNYEVHGFCADKSYINEDKFEGLPVCDFDRIEDTYPNTSHKLFVAVGYTCIRRRVDMYEKALKKCYQFANYISPYAQIDPSTKIGDNNIILQGTNIEPFCSIGNNNIIWSSVTICHDVVIEDHCFIASQTLLGGHVKVCNNSFLGFNCTVAQNVIIAKETLLGAKSLTLNSTNEYSKYIGIP